MCRGCNGWSSSNNAKPQTPSFQAGGRHHYHLPEGNRDALHRVTPTQGEITRMLVVLAYNAEPNVALSESARMTFYGRLT